jgi:hypothetical protein
MAVWPGKKDPNAEVLTVQIRHSTGSSWETVGRLAVYRTSEGGYSQLPERQPMNKTVESYASNNLPDEQENSEDQIST